MRFPNDDRRIFWSISEMEKKPYKDKDNHLKKVNQLREINWLNTEQMI